ncbi:MAG: aminotransferase class I/II-fold pyridoxal phosphate-dependent enzyme, partial [Butyricicoccaceae bacterium]
MKFIRQGDEVAPNIFNQLEDKRQEMLARGVDVINLSVGTPDFPPADHVMRTVQEAASDPKNYKYTLGDIPELTAAVQRWYARRYGVTLEPEQIQSVNGSQEGIAHICFPFLKPGDLVLCPDPGYPIFTFGPMMAGAEIGLLPLLPGNDYLIDFDSIRDE